MIKLPLILAMLLSSILPLVSGLTMSGFDGIDGLNFPRQAQYMGVGASSTLGIGVADNQGWYPELQALLNTKVSFVGPYYNTNLASTTPYYSCGKIAVQIADFVTDVIPGCLPYLDTSLQKTVVILIGSGDVANGTYGCNSSCDENVGGNGGCTTAEETAIANSYMDIVDYYASDASIDVFILEMFDRAPAQDNCNIDIDTINNDGTYGINAQAVAHASYGVNLFWIDTATVNKATMLADNVHLNSLGNTEVASLVSTSRNAN